MSDKLKRINNKLTEILSQEKGYFGRVNTFGQRSEKYEYIGYELTDDFYPTLEKMSEDQKINLNRIIIHFEIHVNPLGKILKNESDEGLYNMYSEIAWSHFMTVVMFGMLEVAVKITPCAQYKDKSLKYLNKIKSIQLFLETYLPEKTRDDIAKRYKTINGIRFQSFYNVIEHLWEEIRSGFVHEAGIESKGMEWQSFKGLGTKENPMTIETDVPMQELMQMTWQAILNSYDYPGLLKLPKYKR